MVGLCHTLSGEVDAGQLTTAAASLATAAHHDRTRRQLTAETPQRLQHLSLFWSMRYSPLLHFRSFFSSALSFFVLVYATSTHLLRFRS